MDAVGVAILARSVNGDGIVLRVDVERRQILQCCADTGIDGHTALNLNLAFFTTTGEEFLVRRIVAHGIDAEATDIDLGTVHEDDAVRVDEGHIARRIELSGNLGHLAARHSVNKQVGTTVLLDIDRGILANVKRIPADKSPVLAFCLRNCHGSIICIDGIDVLFCTRILRQGRRIQRLRRPCHMIKPARE